MLIGYARVSTKQQELALQLDALEKAGCEKVFTEKVSGVKKNRPEFLAALEFVREGDTLVVWKLDRLARSLKQLIETVEGLEKRQIGFQSLTEAIDTTSPAGRLIFHIFASLAEFERSIIRERTRAGLEAARKRGRTGGRSKKLDPDDVAVVKQLLTETSLTIKEIAKQMGVGSATIYRYFPGGREALP